MENIFCVTCNRRVCLLCTLDEHKNHKIMTQNQFVSRQAEFMKRLQETKAAIVDRIAVTEARREQIGVALETIEYDIRKAYDHQVALLLEKKDSLLEAVRSLRDDYGSKLDDMVAGHRQHLEDMAGALRQMQMNLELDPLTILDERSEILGKVFEMPIVDDSSLHLTEQAEGIRFVGNDTVTAVNLLGVIKVPDLPSVGTVKAITTWVWNFISNPLFRSVDKRNSFAEFLSEHDHCAIQDDSGQQESVK